MQVIWQSTPSNRGSPFNGWVWGGGFAGGAPPPPISGVAGATFCAQGSIPAMAITGEIGSLSIGGSISTISIDGSIPDC